MSHPARRASQSVAAGLFAWGILVATCQAQVAPAAVAIAVPDTASVGQTVLLQARLVSSGSAPIAKATVDFTVQQTFLNVNSDVVVAQGVTDDTGLARAQWQVRTSGDLAVKAVYRGGQTYGPATASGAMTASGNQQLYTPTAGVRVPFLNWPPLAALAGLWPHASAWPIALALAIVWSLYARVATLLFRVSRDARGEREP
jgi:hypothetical protein